MFTYHSRAFRIFDSIGSSPASPRYYTNFQPHLAIAALWPPSEPQQFLHFMQLVQVRDKMRFLGPLALAEGFIGLFKGAILSGQSGHRVGHYLDFCCHLPEWSLKDFLDGHWSVAELT